MADTAEEAAIRAAISTPRRMKVDGNEAEAKPIDELIAADEYLKNQTAKAKRGLGVAQFKIRPPGSQ